MATTWVQYTNEEIYLARLQFERAASAELADKVPQRESARQAGLHLLHAAWVGLLNEIAECFKVKGVRINQLQDLENTLGATISEVAALVALREQPDSWLRLFLRDYENCTRPQFKPKGAELGAIPMQVVEDTSTQRYLLMTQDLREYVAAFRERTNEW